MSEKSLLSAFCPKLENYPVQMFEVAWTSFTHGSSLTGSRDKLSNGNPRVSGGGQVDRDRTGTESSRRSSGKWASAGTRLKRLRKS